LTPYVIVTFVAFARILPERFPAGLSVQQGLHKAPKNNQAMSEISRYDCESGRWVSIASRLLMQSNSNQYKKTPEAN
jgi:hypothetical protein